VKELCHFFRVLALLWVNEDFIGDFTSYLDQLVPQIHQLFGISAD